MQCLIFHFCEGRTVEPKIPRFLERKLAIKNDRHFLIHGMADQILTTERISLSKFRFSKAEIAQEEAMMSLDSIIKLGDRAWKLTKSTLAYNIFLLRFAPEDKLTQMLSDPEIKQFFAGFPRS
jgi:hypothetical protein